MDRGQLLFRRLRQPEGLKGKWWLPSESLDKAIPGTLSIDASGKMQLVLNSEFDSLGISGLASFFFGHSIPMLHGLLYEMGDCTLQGLEFVESTFYSSSTTTVLLVRSSLFAVRALVSFDRCKIRDISFSFPCLVDWVETSSVSVLESKTQFKIEADKKRVFSLGRVGNYKGEIAVSSERASIELTSQNISISQESRFTLSFRKQVSLQFAASLLRLIGDFLSLATLHPVSAPYFTCTNKHLKQDPSPVERHGPKSLYLPMFGWHSGLKDEASYGGLSQDAMFFTYSDLQKVGRSDALLLVLERADDFALVLPLLVPEEGRFNSYSTRRFLNATQSLEYLDRMSGHNAVLSDEEYGKMRHRLLKDADAKDQKWLKDRLQYGNEPSLANRMKHVIKANAKLLQTTAKQQEGFVREVVDSRNFFVHLDVEGKSKAATENKLVALTHKTEALARLSFLRALGLDDQDLSVLFSNSKRSYIRYIKELFHPSS